MIQLNKPTECESHDAQTLHVRLVKVAAARTGAESRTCPTPTPQTFFGEPCSVPLWTFAAPVHVPDPVRLRSYQGTIDGWTGRDEIGVYQARPRWKRLHYAAHTRSYS
ncbi:hypothetical protein CPAR01_11684 [Colletotrichum paranaense]|uniref:Uncharacterized protein n=2 Tax=Colletotrichum acutatum species complex TaxID=2707335 RepID=A0AAI9V3A2_9PEZI|nr:uncharacterized protein CPAR01_11684 [Colletotrichum paranaense]KAK1469480.1 hypothetical protein CMEL01_01247 [Colletotrichum melonis]KAK1529372.1 hypothetical protein CPAR01_11684 [Colletotrichum paranaense]